MTGQAAVVIQFGGLAGLKYLPPCITVSPGTKVTFNGNFTFHPLRAGEVKGTMATPDATSPIQATDAGTTAEFTLPLAGTFPYYCNFHIVAKMYGAIFVK